MIFVVRMYVSYYVSNADGSPYYYRIHKTAVELFLMHARNFRSLVPHRVEDEPPVTRLRLYAMQLDQH